MSRLDEYNAKEHVYQVTAEDFNCFKEGGVILVDLADSLRVPTGDVVSLLVKGENMLVPMRDGKIYLRKHPWANSERWSTRIPRLGLPVRVPRGSYKHFKGGLYEVMHNGKDADTNQNVVIYLSHATGEVWVRRSDEFVEHVCRDDYEGPRFVKVEPI